MYESENKNVYSILMTFKLYIIQKLLFNNFEF